MTLEEMKVLGERQLLSPLVVLMKALDFPGQGRVEMQRSLHPVKHCS